MKKIFPLAFISFITILITGCASSFPVQLQRADINTLTDKNFYLTTVNIDSSSSKRFYQSSVGFDKPGLKNDILTALPVESIIKILSNDFNIKIDFSDFKNADLKAAGNSWESNRKNINSIIINYKIDEHSGSNFNFLSSYFTVDFTIIIKTVAGISKNVTVRFPEQKKGKITMYYPFTLAKSKGLSADDVTKFIVMEDIKNIPDRLVKELKEDRLIPVRIE